MARILVINANSRRTATARIAELCRGHEPPGDEFEYAGVDEGPEGIDSLLDMTIAALEVARVVARRRDEFDAFVVACANDPGVDVARQISGKPVVGIAEAGMHFAMTVGATFSILTFEPAEIPWMSELAEHYGLRARLASTVTLDLSTAEVISLGEQQLFERTRAAASRAIDVDGAEVIVLAGSLMVELAPALTRALGVPVLSGMLCGLRLASGLAGVGAVTSAAYKYRTPLKHDDLIGYPELQDAYRARATSTFPGAGNG